MAEFSIFKGEIIRIPVGPMSGTSVDVQNWPGILTIRVEPGNYPVFLSKGSETTGPEDESAVKIAPGETMRWDNTTNDGTVTFQAYSQGKAVITILSSAEFI